MKRKISDFGFRISDFPSHVTRKAGRLADKSAIQNSQSEIPELGWMGKKSEIRNPKSEIEWVSVWTS